MKRLFTLTICFTACCSGIFAQQQPVLKSRKGLNILPEAGNFALGIDANPFLNYVGNMLNNTTNNQAPSFGFVNNNGIIYGKYFKTANVAYRGQLRLGLMSQKSTFYTPKKPVSGNEMAENSVRTKGTNIGLGFGIEKRKGSTRIQGLYGIEGLVFFSSGNDSKYTYANRLEDEDPGTVRSTVINQSSYFNFAIRGFLGVEYFLAPKLSVGGEFGWGPSFFINSGSTSTTEQWDFVNNQLIATKTKGSDKTSGFNFDTDNASGRIKLMFHF